MEIAAAAPAPNDPLVIKSKKRKATAEPIANANRKSKLQVFEQTVREVVAAPAVDFKPRSYQLEVLEKAMAENTIVFLETGAGKTHIAVMLLNKLEERLSLPDEKRIGIFLTPTVALADQQAKVISSSSRLKVGVYHGVQMDTWNMEIWKNEINARQVLVMTPQVLFNALQLQAIRMETIEVLIFDECHSAQKSHPYAAIMKTYYHSSPSTKRPRIFGMTGSLIATKGACSDDEKIREQMRKLENILDSKIYTLKDRTELEEKVPTPLYRSRYYGKPYFSFQDLHDKLSALLVKYQTEQNNFTGVCKSDDQKKKCQSLSNIHNAISGCLKDLGLWSAIMAVEIFLKVEPSAGGEPMDDYLLQSNYETEYLKETYDTLRRSLPEESSCSLSSPDDLKVAIRRGLISTKLKALLQIILRYKDIEAFRCMVFVERVIVSQVLARLLGRFQCVNFTRPGYMVGVNAGTKSNKHLGTLNSFRDGTVNLVICTSVAEEGLDVQTCNCVIRFDLCHNVRSFIQSRGRARKANADYFFLLERGNSEQEKIIYELIHCEKVIRTEALSRNFLEIMPEMGSDVDLFYTKSGACISTDGSVAFLYKFCSQLPMDRFYTPKPDIEITKADSSEDELFICTVTLPPNAPIHSVTGTPKRTKQLAKRVACLEACRQLDALGALSVCEKSEKVPVPQGTTRLKELFPSVQSTTFQRQWITTTSEICLHMYTLIFHPGETSEHFTNFVLLFDTALDDDVGNITVDLYLTRKRAVKAKLSSAGQCRMDPTQVAAGKAYQEIMFNGAFSRLVFRENPKDRTIAKSLFSCEEKSKNLWSETYLLLPVIFESCDIDWDIVKACAEAARLLPGLCTELNKSEICMDRPDTDIIYTARGPVETSELQDSVVLTVHTGRLFCITEILHNLNAKSTLQSEDSNSYTYEEFYLRKHGRLLQYQNQPFLRAKPTHALHNHVHKPHETNKQRAPFPKNFVELPPELCIILGAKSSMIRSLYLIPSFMFRFTSYLIASELRTKLTKHFPCAHASKILEALTSSRCDEGFTYEGLETLGDSVLKYAVSRKLFLAQHNMHEGDLSSLRSHAISNATLRNLAVAQDLPAYIRDEPFYHLLWVGAGMHRQKSRTCCCNLENLVTKESSSPKPVDDMYYVGMTCGQGHRWMCSKTTSDVVEALIGAYELGGGFDGALEFMKALKVDVEFDDALIPSSQLCSSVALDLVQQHMPTLLVLERDLLYSFQNKALLLEAITHASASDTVFCYQRLEFLGDAVLDYLMTRYLFATHSNLTPGLLSDLRAASVNNGCLARAAVKYRLDCYLRYDSADLQEQIKQFVETVGRDTRNESVFGFNALTVPKVLSDVVESILGAILVDSSFDLEKTWIVCKRLLSPLVTPETLSHHPVRELHELCQSNRWKFEWVQSSSGATAELLLTAGEKRFNEMSWSKIKKIAKKEVAGKMLATLKKLGYDRHPTLALAPTEEQQLVPNTVQDVPQQNKEEITCLHIDSKLLASNCQALSETLECGNVSASNDIHGVEPASNDSRTRTSDQTSCKMDIADGEDKSFSKTFSAIHEFEVDLHALPIETSKCVLQTANCAIVLLEEYCNQKNLGSPRFEAMERRGLAQGLWFSFTVSVEVPGEGLVEQVSCFMANRDKAKDDAAEKMLQRLKSSLQL